MQKSMIAIVSLLPALAAFVGVLNSDLAVFLLAVSAAALAQMLWRPRHVTEAQAALLPFALVCMASAIALLAGSRFIEGVLALQGAS